MLGTECMKKDNILIYFDECYPLFNNLTEEEQNEASENNGIFTTSELDEISERINKEYKEKISWF